VGLIGLQDGEVSDQFVMKAVVRWIMVIYKAIHRHPTLSMRAIRAMHSKYRCAPTWKAATTASSIW
jgi:hypothetical protein